MKPELITVKKRITTHLLLVSAFVCALVFGMTAKTTSAAEVLADEVKSRKVHLYLNDFESFSLDFDYNVGKMLKLELENQLNQGNEKDDLPNRVYPKTLSYNTEASNHFCKNSIMLLTPLKWLQFQEKLKDCHLQPIMIAQYYNQKEPYYSASIVVHKNSDLWANQDYTEEETEPFNLNHLQKYSLILGPTQSASSHFMPLWLLWTTKIIAHPSVESAKEAGITILGGSTHSSVIDQLQDNTQAIAATQDIGTFTKVNERGCIYKSADYLSNFPKGKKLQDLCKPDLHILFRYGRIPNDVIVVSKDLVDKAGFIMAFFQNKKVHRFMLAGLKIDQFVSFQAEHKWSYGELKRRQDLVNTDLAEQDNFDWSVVLPFLGHLGIMTIFCILVRWLNQTGINRTSRFYVLAVVDSISMMLLLINIPTMQVVKLNMVQFIPSEILGSIFWGICVAAVPSTSILQNLVSSIFDGIEKGIKEINVNPRMHTDNMIEENKEKAITIEKTTDQTAKEKG